MKLKKYDVEFKELFDSKRQAVVQFISLEQRYIEAIRELAERRKDEPWPVK